MEHYFKNSIYKSGRNGGGDDDDEPPVGGGK